MQKRLKKLFTVTGALFLLFTVFTLMLKIVDVQPIGPMQSKVGFATVNQAVSGFFGVNLLWKDITDWLGNIAVAVAFGFVVFGLFQLIKRKNIRKVDSRILLLGGFYVILGAAYVFFEAVIINYRPVILLQNLEASYPSSHTMLVICIMVTAMLQFHHYMRNKKLWIRIADIASVLIIVITVIGRLVSGVHWFTDILGGVLLSSALIALFGLSLNFVERARSKE